MDMMLTLLKLLNNDFSEEKVMLNREWKQFKSGTDIRGVAVEYKENKVNLTDDAVRADSFLVTRKGGAQVVLYFGLAIRSAKSLLSLKSLLDEIQEFPVNIYLVFVLML